MRFEVLLGVLVVILYYVSTEVEGQRVSGLSIRPHRCGPICYMYCPNGFVTDHRGCPICRCRRQSVSGLSIRPPRCSGRMCRMYCRYGFVTDHRGCPICRCRPGPGPISTSRCPRGSSPVRPRRTCSSFSIRPRRCGRNAFCSPTPADGLGICCRRWRPVIRPRPIGQCPPSSGFSTCQFTQNNCLSDRECRLGQRCCPDGCGSVCKRIQTFPFGGYV